jgi:hypothetical protein
VEWVLRGGVRTSRFTAPEAARSIILTISLALFNVMLREFGVEGVKVQEVVSLDKEIMDLLPHVSRSLSFRRY